MCYYVLQIALKCVVLLKIGAYVKRGSGNPIFPHVGISCLFRRNLLLKGVYKKDLITNQREENVMP
jgi:hypothetical protein